MPGPAISLAGVRKRFDGDLALDGVDLDVEAGRFVTLFGPSGCGKSTLLRLVAGLLAPDEGAVRVFGGSPAAAADAKQIGFVPQVPALLPWRSVLDNVRLPLQVNRRAARRRGRAGGGPERGVDARELLRRVGLADAADRRPSQLSGGMAQRVAIARALAAGPSLLLMDEPFSALDELTRETLRQLLLELWEVDRSTVLFVTHSASEAVYLSDQVVVVSPRPGRVTYRIDVPLPRPRPADIELSDAFRTVEGRIRAALRAGRDGEAPPPPLPDLWPAEPELPVEP